MSTVTALVVEDNSIVAEDITHSLNDLGYEVVQRTKTGADAVEAAKSHRPDIILMDINLKGNMDGIEASEHINKNTPTPIIYLTAYSDNKTFERAKKTHPFAYIVKPFVEKDLGLAIDLAIHNFAHSAHETDPGKAGNEHIIKDIIFLKIEKRFIKILVADILFIQAAGSYCNVHTNDNEYLLTMNLHTFESKITHSDLMRVNRSFVVNIRRVDSFEKHCLHVGDIEVSISKPYEGDFQKRFLAV